MVAGGIHIVKIASWTPVANYRRCLRCRCKPLEGCDNQWSCVVDNGGAPCIFKKNIKMALKELSGARGNWFMKKTVLGIHDILVRIQLLIQILGSVPLTNGSGMPIHKIRILRIRIRNTSKKSLKSPKPKKSRFFELFLLDDGRIRSRIRCWIRSRIRTCDYRIR